MPKTRLMYVIPTFAMALVAGCATVDPQHDYQRVAEVVSAATGYDEIYRPGDDELVAAKIGELLEGGLTSHEAVQLCLLNNPRLQAAFFDVGMARADVVQSGLLSNPSLGISLRLPAGGGLAAVEGGLAQNIADLWQIPTRRRAARRDLDRAILRLAHKATVLSVEAKAAYYQAVAADRLRAIAAENLGIVQQLLDIALARQEAGAGTEVEVNLSRSEVGETDLVGRQAELAAYEARGQLAALLGLGMPADELELVEALPEPPEVAVEGDRLLRLALDHRLDIQAAREVVASAEALLELERLRFFRSLEIGVDFERAERGRSEGRHWLSETAQATAAAGTLTPPTIGPDGGKDHDFTIGPSISLELPLFDQNQAQIARAEYGYDQAVKMLEALTREITQEARLAYERSRISWDNEVFYREQLLPLRRTSLDLAREAYRAGRTSFLSVLEAQRNLVEARAAYIAARQQSALALAGLEGVTGRPIDVVLSALGLEDRESDEAPEDEEVVAP